ncbi:MAG: hypothetical protein AAF460_01230 [Pseudomonadota bacterium]
MFTQSGTAAIPADQLAVLDALEQRFELSTTTVDHADWATGIDCQSSGVFCDSDDNVIGLEMYGGTTNSLPDKVGDLEKLETLKIVASGLSGDLPSSFFTLSALRVIDFDAVQFNRPLPVELAQLTALETLSITDSGLYGSLPPELATLPRLRTLRFAANSLSGELPPEYRSLTTLETLDLQVNELVGNIPAEYAELVSLQTVYLNDNSLVGEIPRSLVQSHETENRQTLWFLAFNGLHLPVDLDRPTRLISTRSGETVPAWQGLEAAYQVWDARVRDAIVRPDGVLTVKWESYDWRNQTIAFWPVNQFGYYHIRIRQPGGAWQGVALLIDVPRFEAEVDLPAELASGALEVRVDETQEFSGVDGVPRYVESSGEQAPPFTVRRSENTPPTFPKPDDLVLSSGYQVGANAWEFPGWALPFQFNDSAPQAALPDVRYISNQSLLPGNIGFSYPSGTLRVSLNGGAAGEALVHLRICDKDLNDTYNLDIACSAEQHFVIRTDGSRPGMNRLPRFTQATTTLQGTETSWQTVPHFATGLRGTDGDTTAHLAFFTAGLDGAALFEHDPWVSYPSGTLRYKLKPGVVGTAVYYFDMQQLDPGTTVASVIGSTRPWYAVSKLGKVTIEVDTRSDAEKAADNVNGTDPQGGSQNDTLPASAGSTLSTGAEGDTSGGGAALALCALLLVRVRRMRLLHIIGTR